MNTTPEERDKKTNNQASTRGTFDQSIECIKNWRTCEDKEKEKWANKFIMLNQFIVDKEVEKHAFLAESTILEMHDLVAYGYEGLMNVMKLYALDNKTTFSHFINTKVRYHIRKGIDDSRSSFSMTTLEKEKINHMNRLMVKHNLTYRQDQDEILLKHLHVSKAQLKEMKKFEEACIYNLISLDEVRANLKEDEFIDTMQRLIDKGNETSVEAKVISKSYIEYIVNEAKKTLGNTILWEVYIRYFGLIGHEEHRVYEIADSINKGQSYTQQLKDKAINKVKFRAKIVHWYKEDE
ncbi:hypothetical protein ACY2DA_01465 [Staphylococcus simulans]